MAIDFTSASQPSGSSARTSTSVVAALCAAVAGLGVLRVGLDVAAAHGTIGAIALAFIAAQIGWLTAAVLLTVRGIAGGAEDDDEGDGSGIIRLEVPFGLIANAENDDLEDAVALRPASEAHIVQLRRAR